MPRTGAFLPNMLGIKFGGGIRNLLMSLAGEVLLLFVYGLIAKRQALWIG